MRKLLVFLLLSTAAYGSSNGTVAPLPVKGEKGEKGKEVVLKVVPLTPPKPIVSREEDEFERQLEALKKQFKLMELKLKIEKIKAEMEKLQQSSLNVPAPQTSQPAPAVEPARPLETSESPETKFREKLLQIKLQQQQQRLLQAKLSYLQNLFTGIVDVSGQRVAFDSLGRKYTVGSFVEGFRIVQILPDGVVVAGNVAGTPITYKVPISSGLSSPKRVRLGSSPETPLSLEE